MYRIIEKQIDTRIKNGHFREQIIDKENVNGKIKIKKKINTGIIDKGKLRKKKVTFTSKIEYIKPGYESVQCKKKRKNKTLRIKSSL